MTILKAPVCIGAFKIKNSLVSIYCIRPYEIIKKMGGGDLMYGISREHPTLAKNIKENLTAN